MNLGYFSHVPLLAAAIQATTGPVLELGAGFGSTFLLHGLCGAQKRGLTTIESDKVWLQQFISYGRAWHKFRLVEDFIDIPEYAKEWGLAFVDHGIAEQRCLSVEALQHVSMIVCHDTCHPRLYGYEPALQKFKYCWNYRITLPQTTVVSNSIDVANLFTRMAL